MLSLPDHVSDKVETVYPVLRTHDFSLQFPMRSVHMTSDKHLLTYYISMSYLVCQLWEMAVVYFSFSISQEICGYSFVTTPS